MEHVTFDFEGLSVYQKALGFFIVFVVFSPDSHREYLFSALALIKHSNWQRSHFEWIKRNDSGA